MSRKVITTELRRKIKRAFKSHSASEVAKMFKVSRMTVYSSVKPLTQRNAAYSKNLAKKEQRGLQKGCFNVYEVKDSWIV